MLLHDYSEVMAKTDFKSVDEYIATFPQDVQTILKSVRQAVLKAVPEAEEVISYQLPAYKYHGFVLYFGGYTKHFSISSPPPTFEVFKEELASYKVSKSAVQFPYDQPVPTELIGKIARYRADENSKKAKK
jgi:uncharacterized protein YdhG (YjbR/CyaY superfamily)